MLTFFNQGKAEKLLSSEAQSCLQLVRGYWEALRHAGRLPSRGDIDPRGLSGVLERVFLIERVAHVQARFRLSGMHLHDLLGMDARGIPLGSFFEPVARTRLTDELEQVFSHHNILTLHLEAERSLAQPALAACMQILPLAHDNGTQQLALGCLVSEGKIGRSPRRFAIAQLHHETITLPGLTLVSSASKTAPDRRMTAPRPALRLVSSRD